MEFLAEYGLFFAKTVTFVIAVGVIILLMVSAGLKNQSNEKGHLEVTKVNDKFDDLSNVVKTMILGDDEIKADQKEKKRLAKEEKKKKKSEAKNKKKDESLSAEAQRKRIFVADFDGDIKASATEELREVVTAILSIAGEGDEVVLRLESSGGMVHSYGLASSQLRRITSSNIPLTVCVDKVAASGGYMMACVAHKIVSAPFAIIGSIGVVAQLPNFHRLLKKHDVDYEMLTAGEYKRTLTMFGENTDKGREKFVEDLEDTHELFKDFISENRDKVDVESVATGEIWFGSRALEKNLVDQLETSDQYLFNLKDDHDIFELKFVHKKSIAEKIGLNVEHAVDRAFTRAIQSMNTRFFS
ncbi:MAG: protease SohB [Agarilytica sp.]